MCTADILKEIKKIVDKANSILLSGQGNPDGDSLSSQLALYEILTQQKQYDENLDIVISNDKLPSSNYNFLSHFNVITPVEEIRHRQFDVGFILDSARDRIGKTLPILQNCQYTINIDHHSNRPKSEEDIVWINNDVSSVAEMLYAFIEHPDWNVILNAEIAACLYTGIIYDTGNFSYASTSASTHRIVAKLLETGIDFVKITEQVLLEKSFSALQLLSAVLHDLQRDPTGEIIWSTITQEFLKRVQAQPEDVEDIITQYTFTKGVKVAVLFKELSANTIKVVFRSRGAIDVGRFSQQLNPQGGGHQRAAGCMLQGTLEEVQEKVIHALQDVL